MAIKPQPTSSVDSNRVQKRMLPKPPTIPQQYGDTQQHQPLTGRVNPTHAYKGDAKQPLTARPTPAQSHLNSDIYQKQPLTNRALPVPPPQQREIPNGVRFVRNLSRVPRPHGYLKYSVSSSIVPSNGGQPVPPSAIPIVPKQQRQLPRPPMDPHSEDNRKRHLHDVHKEEGDTFMKEGSHDKALDSYNSVSFFYLQLKKLDIVLEIVRIRELLSADMLVPLIIQ